MTQALEKIFSIGLFAAFFFFVYQARGAEDAGNFEDEVRYLLKASISLISAFGWMISGRIQSMTRPYTPDMRE